LEDLSAHAGVDSQTFLDRVQSAPPAQKAWQIAGGLLAESSLRGLPPDRYLDLQERLSAAVDQAVPALNEAVRRDPAAVHQEVSGRVLSTLGELEAEARVVPPPAQEMTIDPRTGVAGYGAVPVARHGGDGSVPYRGQPQATQGLGRREER